MEKREKSTDEKQDAGDRAQERMTPDPRTLNPHLICFLIVIFCFLFSAPCTLNPAYAEESAADTQSMRAEYDEISAIKMKKYDELMREISEIRERLKGLLEKEQELSGEKKKAAADLAERSRAEEIARENVKKVLKSAADEDEKIKSFSAVATKESEARRAKIEDLKKVLIDIDAEMKQKQSLKSKAEEENAALDKERKDVSDRLLVLEKKSSLKMKKEAGGESELARLKKLMGGLEMKSQEGERVRQRLAEEILATAEKIQPAEEEISALEREDALQVKEMRAKIEDLNKAKGEDQETELSIEKAKKTAEETSLKVVSGKAALKKVEDELEKVSVEKAQAEKDLGGKIDELKIRISALVVQNERDQKLFPEDAQAVEKNMKTRLRRAEKDVASARRKAEKALLVNKEYKVKYDKEILEKHFNLAVVYEMNGLYKDAEREYRECLKIDPRDADVHYNLAILYDDRLNSNSKAQKHYYKYLSCRPIEESGERVRDWVLRAELEKRLGSSVR